MINLIIMICIGAMLIFIGIIIWVVYKHKKKANKFKIDSQNSLSNWYKSVIPIIFICAGILVFVSTVSIYLK